jgi:hypothetical protein
MITIPPKQNNTGKAIDGCASRAVIQRLIMKSMKFTYETNKVLREIIPLDVNRKADMNKPTAKSTVIVSEP